MVDCRFEVRLKQHTPMIHFQHDQTGATLRATEVKPKLDAFLKEKMGLDALGGCKGKQGNLLYRLTIRPDPEGAVNEPVERTKKDRKGVVERKKDGSPKTISFPNYFGDMGEKEERHFIKNDTVDLSFFSYHTQLLEGIQMHLPDFLFKTNFGTRQSKGFGSFYIDPEDKKHYKPPPVNQRHFRVAKGNGDIYAEYRLLFEHIDLFYRTLRSGINLKNAQGDTVFYFKSMLFFYAKSKGWLWDKRLFKDKFLADHHLRNEQARHPHSDLVHDKEGDGYLVRDLLGLAPIQEFLKPEKFTIKYDKDNPVQRFRSPITFKPIENSAGGFDVYLITTPIPAALFGKKFQINKLVDKNALDHIGLETPPENTFDIDEYLDFAIRKMKPETLMAGYENLEQFKIISNIYTDLERSTPK